MKISFWSVICAGALVAGCDSGSNRSSTSSDSDSSTVRAHELNTNTLSADNTGRNVRDRADATLTPGDQGKTDADIETTRNIRRALTSNDQLSTTAKNIKIITMDGKVTLRGPVQSEQEKNTILGLVQQAGAGQVDNQLEVKTSDNK